MKFEKAKFDYHGGYLTYEGEFVARFKYSTRDKGPFITFLRKHFEVEEYFGMLKDPDMAPVTILQTKGYVSATVKRILKQAGFPPTQAGYKAFIEKQCEEHYA